MQCMDLKTGQNLPHGAGVPCVAALGNFDGVHLGHRAILHATTTLAKQHSLVPAVFTFATHPKQAPLLCTNEERLEHMRACGIRFVYLYNFPSLQHNSPQTFVRDILIKEMQTQIAVSGENFHFGENGDGTTETLQQAMQTAGKETYVVPMVYAYGDTVSSRTRGDTNGQSSAGLPIHTERKYHSRVAQRAQNADSHHQFSIPE